MRAPRLDRRIYPPLAVAVLLTLGAALAILFYERRVELAEAREQDRAAVARFARGAAAEHNAVMEGALIGILHNPELLAAFRVRDRARLLADAAPILQQLNDRQKITQLYFHQPDGTVFLRVHQPDLYGDTIDRVTFREAVRTQTITTGYERGRTRGLPAFRAVSPWRVNGELLGYVELGYEIGGLVDQLREALDVHAFIVLDKSMVLRDAWEQEMRAAGRNPAWDRYPNVVLVEGTLPVLPRALDTRFARLERIGGAEVVDAEIDGVAYQGETQPMSDAGGLVTGELVFLRDRSRMLAAYNRDLAGFIALFVLATLAAWLALRRTVYRSVLRPLEELRGVTERATRGELMETMLAERRDEMGDLGRAVNGLIGELRRRQDESMRRIVDAAHDGVILADVNGVITGWNTQAQVIFGWLRDEAIGRTLTETVVPENQHSAHLAGMRRYREGNRQGAITNRRVELIARRKNGDLFPAEITVTPIHSSDGVAFAAFVRDITDRRHSEAALRASEERFRRLVETANVVPWEASLRSTRVTYVGPQAEALLGFPMEDWYQEGFWINQVHPDDKEHALTQLTLVAGRMEKGELEYRMTHADGRTVWVRDIVVADVTDDGPVLRGFRFDITDRRRLEEDLLQSQKMEAVGRLAGGIAHDFNNLLTAILGYTTLIESSFPLGTTEHADVGEIRRAAGQAADLTQQLLAFARKQVVRPRVIVIDDLVRRLDKMMGRLIGEDLILTMRAAAGSATVWVDPGRFEQAMVNLLFNARDALPRGGTITLSSAVTDVDAATAASEGVEPGSFVVISIADTGMGMSSDTRARVFEPFFTTKPEGKGTGLGLSTVYGVVHQAGGFLEVDSAPGRGSTFRVFLPLARDEAPAESAVAGEASNLNGHETVLVAEDEPQLRALTERMLQRHGYRVLLAQNGAEAIEQSRAYPGRIHLLLTDVVMPVMGGVRAADSIRAARPGIGVLFVSGYSEESLFREGEETVVNFLGKPFTPDELVRKVRDVLDGVEVESI